MPGNVSPQTSLMTAPVVRCGAAVAGSSRRSERKHGETMAIAVQQSNDILARPVSARASAPRALVADIHANMGHPKELLVVCSLRISQSMSTVPVLGLLATVLHRLLTEILIGIELRPATQIGPGLKLFHCYATVINTGTTIGANVKIHQSVTIGAKKTGERCPTIGDRVAIGSGAIILGDITIGADSVIGAGAVVVKDVPAGSTVVGNPARIIKSALQDRP